MQIDMGISLGTIIALIALSVSIIALAYVVYLERKRDFENKKAIINSLFNEIDVNNRISRDPFVKDVTDNFIRKICQSLLIFYGGRYRGETNRRSPIYPDPSQNILEFTTNLYNNENSDVEIFNELEKEFFFKDVELKKLPPSLVGKKHLLKKYHTDAIEKAISAGTIWNVIGNRIIHNLISLNHCLSGFNELHENFGEILSFPKELENAFQYFNLNRKLGFDTFTFHYWEHLHFKLWFTFLDLALSTDDDIIEHFEFERLKERIDNIDGLDWDELHETLSKTRNQNFYPIKQNS